MNEEGEVRTNIEELKEHGAVAFSDDGVGIQLASTMLEQMKDAAKVDAVVVAHCEDNSLIYDGVMHEGIRNKELGLPGIPSVCESVQIARDVLLAEAAVLVTTYVTFQQKNRFVLFEMRKKQEFK